MLIKSAFPKIIFAFFVAGAIIGAAILAADGPTDSIGKINWARSLFSCIKMMFAPVVNLPFGDIVTIENGVASPNPPSFVALVLMNAAVYAAIGAVIGGGYVWARWLMYGMFGVIAVYWAVCIWAIVIT